MSGQPLPGVTALLVEPHQEFAANLEKNVELLGCTVGGIATSAMEAIEIVADRPIDLVFIDEGVAGSDLSFLISQLSARGLPYIFVSGDARDRAGRLEPVIHRNATADRLAHGMREALANRPRTWPADKWQP